MADITYNLTNPQKSIWFTEEFYKGTPMENIAGSVIINEKVNFKLLTKAINLFAKNNESFNFRFNRIENDVVQSVQPFEEFSIEILDVQTEKDVKIYEKKLANTPFEVINSKLYSAQLFKFEDGHGGFIISIHHLIADAWTSGLIIDGIINIYSELLENPDKTDFEFPSYLDYISAEQKYLNSDKFAKDKAFWNDLYKEAPEIASIPSFNVANKQIEKTAAKRKVFKLPKETFSLINDYAKEHKASPFNFFMGIFSLYIGRVSNLDEFVIGTPILNRSNFKDKHTTGMFISTVPFKVNINNELTFGDFISKISGDFFDIFRHQKYPYQYLLEDLRKDNPSLPNLYDIAMSYQNMRTDSQISKIDFTSSWCTPDYIPDSLDVHLFDLDDTGTINIAYDYQVSKYTLDDICSIHARILNIINQVLENSNILLKDLEIVTPDEKTKLLYTFNDTQMDYPKDKTISQLFEEQVEKTPDNIAVVFGDEKLTYKELNEKANSLANYLRNNGVSRNDIVGIMVNRSLEMIVSIMAVLKSGACYIPIDPEYPEDRISYMLYNSNSKFLLTFKSLDNDVKFDNKIFVELSNDLYNENKTNLENINSPEDLAYIIYTSGSTGKPKGVMLKHKNINNFITGTTNVIDFKEKNIVSLTTISFDIFVLESLLPLQNGLTIIIANEQEQLNAKLFNKLCIKNNVNIIQTTPSRFQALISDNESLKYMDSITDILVGGEPFPISLLEKLQKISNAKIYNMYGPTETAVWSTIKDLSKENSINIGKPIANTQVYILDKNKNLVPPLVPGELYIGGDGVCNGYYNLDELTKEKFSDNKYNLKSLIYNTNDLAYYTNDGELVHLGRSDFQVKIRGYRIELEEIENAVLQFNGITQSAVLGVDNKYLVCYYTANKEINHSELAKFLLGLLPNYMIPAHFQKISAFPSTPNGKIDRKKLPKVDTNIAKEILPPRNNVDEELLDLFKNLLNVDQVSIDDNFFYLGGDSLSAINLCTQIYSKFNATIYVKDILEHPVIMDLSDLIVANNTKTSSNTVINKTLDHKYYPLSSAQSRIYYSSKLAGNNTTLYNISNALILDKIPDISKLENAFIKLIERQPSLRTYFDIEEEKVVQKIENSINFKLDIATNYISNSQITESFNDFVKPFNLKKAPLFRTKLFKLENNKAILMIDMHHIISDGISLSIIVDNVCKLYNNEAIPELKIDYKDYSVWENTNLKNGYFDEAEKYWISNFKDEIPVLNLAIKPRPAVQSFEGDKVYNKIDQLNYNKIHKLSKDLGITPYMFLLSAYYILLYKYTFQENIVVGTPIANRKSSDLSNIVGMFVNSLPIKININSTLSFGDFVNFVKNKCLESYKYQEYPFDELVNKLNIPRDASRNPIFDTMFIYQSNGYPKISFDEIKASYYTPHSKVSKFDLSLEVIPNDTSFDLSFEFSTKLFDKKFIENLSAHYINIINNILSNNDIKISDINMLSEDERNKILYDFNNTNMDYPNNKTISQLFEDQAEKTPNNIALVFEDCKLTFKELNEKANSLAYYLRSKYNIKNNDIVGIMMSRSLEVIIAMLAVIKAGGAYIPIDPSFPKDRIDYMLETSKAKILLTQKKLENNINYTSKLSIDLNNKELYNLPNINLENINTYADLVYLIFTSGSTGKPKGVMVTHRVLSNFINYCNDYVKYLRNSQNQIIASITTISFDIFVYETLISLQKGVKVIIANENEQTTPSLLNSLMQKNNVNIIQSTPSVMQIFINSKKDMPMLKNLNYVILAGEQLPLDLVKALHKLANITVYNGYGPSETYYSTLFEMNDKLITIGKPIYNSQMYILDKNMNPVPIGITGEIYISGDCVGNGYLNNQELTNKSFISNPFLPNTRMYKSGDLGKYLDDGNILCLGRVDHQVKIRGLRIELGEIESLLLKYPNVSKATVVKQTIDNREFISAYYVSDKRISANSFREYFSKYLPKYMVPSYYIPLNDLPYTPNGKVDKKNLPLPTIIENTVDRNYLPPETSLQKQLVNIWEKILNTKPIGINDNFFELGGDSLLAMTLNLEISKFSNKVTYQDIFHFPTICGLENLINSDEKVALFKKIENLSTNTLKVLNTTTQKQKIKKQKFSNILLTGSTGFLGIHILSELLNTSDTKIHCIVREEPGINPKNKLLQKLNYYFGNKYDNFIDKRIFIINGNICEPNFGIQDKEVINTLIASIDVVINSAANVAHFGNYNNFYKTNVLSVKYAVDFCKKYDKKLYHISTMGVAGLSLDSTYPSSKKKNNIIFDESSLYIGQEPETVYTYTKFQAEIEVLNEINNGLNGYILRIGNLMPRYRDGVFQDNVHENEFLNKIASFVRIGIVPDYLMSYSLEITPVDCAANAICKIITHSTDLNRIFHIFDHKRVPISKCLKLLKSDNYDLKILTEDEFVNKIGYILKNEESQKMLEFISDDFDNNTHISYESNMTVKSTFTKNYLKKLGFYYPRISTKYLKNFINILRGVI